MTFEEWDKLCDGLEERLKTIIEQARSAENELVDIRIKRIEETIKAVKQEPCEDAISRQAVLDLAEWFRINQQHFTVDNLIDEVENIPSVNPKPNPVHLIDEAKLLKAIDTWDKFGVDDTNSLFRLDNLSLPHYVPYMRYDDVVKCIKGMPSVTPKTELESEEEIGPDKKG